MRRALTVGLMLLLAAGVAFAQETTSGILEGTVLAQDTGDPIVGAVITAVGPQGARTSVTDGSGRYTIRGLGPGDYLVKAESTGFATIVQSDVQVNIGTRTQLPFTLPVGQVEEITVTSEAPVVDMKSTGTGQTIRVDDFAPYVPLGRNIVATFAIAPGVADGGTIGAQNQSISGSSGLENAYFVDGVNITNSGFGALGSYSIVYGSLGTGVTYDFLEEVQVKTGGFEAEFGQAGGGVVNSVVRTGTNTFGFDVAWYEEPTSFEGNRNDRLDAPNIANFNATLRRDISLSAGGPILKDKLFYFAAYNPVIVEQDFTLTSGDPDVGYYLTDTNGDGVILDSDLDVNGDGVQENFADQPWTFDIGGTIRGGRVPEEVTRERTIDNYAAKFSWFATPNHKIEFTAFGDPSDGEVGPQAPTQFLRNLTETIAIPDPTTGATGLEYGGDQLSLKYQGVWTSNFFTEIQVAQKENNFTEIGPGTSVRSFFDVAANTTFGGAGFYEDKLDETTQFSLKNTHVFGPVELRYGIQIDDMDFADPSFRSGPTFEAYFARVGDVDTDGDGVADALGFTDPACVDGTAFGNAACYTTLPSTTGAAVDIESNGNYNVTRTAFEPLDSVTTNEETNFFVQATWDVLSNLTVKAGLRYTEQELTGSGTFTMPFSTDLDFGTVTGIGSEVFTAKNYKFDSELAPRIGIAWDVMNNGRHKVYANYGEYYQRVPSDLAVRQFSNEVGVEGAQFLDADLMIPAMTNDCALDLDGDGVYDDTTACHLMDGVTGAHPGVILDGTVDPDGDPDVGPNPASKLPYTEEWLAGYAWEINDYTSIEVRYINRELGRVLEDVQFASNEQIWNEFFGGLTFSGEVFEGHGVGSFGAYVLANPGDNVNTVLFPVPQRNYKAMEVVFNRRFNNNWMAYVNYRWSKLQGNYEGSYRNDNGQSDPFITSLFDIPAASATPGGGFIESATLKGQYISGPLNTDRTHILNSFVSKQFDFGLNLGARMTFQSGQPRFPLFAHPTYRNAGEIPGSNPLYWWLVNVDLDGDGVRDGRGVYTDADATLTTMPNIDYNDDGVADTALGISSGPRLFSYDPVKRDHFGRNPSLLTFDVHASYDIDLRGGQSKLTLMLDIFNLFDENDALTFDNNIETRPGNPNPDYLKANLFNGPRNVRLGAKFTW